MPHLHATVILKNGRPPITTPRQLPARIYPRHEGECIPRSHIQARAGRNPNPALRAVEAKRLPYLPRRITRSWFQDSVVLIGREVQSMAVAGPPAHQPVRDRVFA